MVTAGDGGSPNLLCYGFIFEYADIRTATLKLLAPATFPNPVLALFICEITRTGRKQQLGEFNQCEPTQQSHVFSLGFTLSMSAAACFKCDQPLVAPSAKPHDWPLPADPSVPVLSTSSRPSVQNTWCWVRVQSSLLAHLQPTAGALISSNHHQGFFFLDNDRSTTHAEHPVSQDASAAA